MSVNTHSCRGCCLFKGVNSPMGSNTCRCNGQRQRDFHVLWGIWKLGFYGQWILERLWSCPPQFANSVTSWTCVHYGCRWRIWQKKLSKLPLLGVFIRIFNTSNHVPAIENSSCSKQKSKNPKNRVHPRDKINCQIQSPFQVDWIRILGTKLTRCEWCEVHDLIADLLLFSITPRWGFEKWIEAQPTNG